MALHGPVGISESGFFNYRHSPFTETVIKGAAMDNGKKLPGCLFASHSSKDILRTTVQANGFQPLEANYSKTTWEIF